MVPQHLKNNTLRHHIPDRPTGKAIQVCGLELQFLVHRFQASVSVFGLGVYRQPGAVNVCRPIKRRKLIKFPAYWQSK